jgi:hypothetical protein
VSRHRLVSRLLLAGIGAAIHRCVLLLTFKGGSSLIDRDGNGTFSEHLVFLTYFLEKSLPYE